MMKVEASDNRAQEIADWICCERPEYSRKQAQELYSRGFFAQVVTPEFQPYSADGIADKVHGHILLLMSRNHSVFASGTLPKTCSSNIYNQAMEYIRGLPITPPSPSHLSKIEQVLAALFITPFMDEEIEGYPFAPKIEIDKDTATIHLDNARFEFPERLEKLKDEIKSARNIVFKFSGKTVTTSTEAVILRQLLQEKPDQKTIHQMIRTLCNCPTRDSLQAILFILECIVLKMPEEGEGKWHIFRGHDWLKDRDTNFFAHVLYAFAKNQPDIAFHVLIHFIEKEAPFKLALEWLLEERYQWNALDGAGMTPFMHIPRHTPKTFGMTQEGERTNFLRQLMAMTSFEVTDRDGNNSAHHFAGMHCFPWVVQQAGNDQNGSGYTPIALDLMVGSSPRTLAPPYGTTQLCSYTGRDRVMLNRLHYAARPFYSPQLFDPLGNIEYPKAAQFWSWSTARFVTAPPSKYTGHPIAVLESIRLNIRYSDLDHQCGADQLRDTIYALACATVASNTWFSDFEIPMGDLERIPTDRGRLNIELEKSRTLTDILIGMRNSLYSYYNPLKWHKLNALIQLVRGRGGVGYTKLQESIKHSI